MMMRFAVRLYPPDINAIVGALQSTHNFPKEVVPR